MAGLKTMEQSQKRNQRRAFDYSLFGIVLILVVF